MFDDWKFGASGPVAAGDKKAHGSSGPPALRPRRTLADPFCVMQTVALLLDGPVLSPPGNP